MEINQHICFSKEKAPEFVAYLQQHNISFTNTGGLLTLDILQSNSHWEEVNNFVQANHLVCLSETIFTQKELADARWLCLRGKWRCGYPQPESKFGYIKSTYSVEQYCEKCGTGLSQRDSFRMKASPKWGNRHYMMLNWVEDELFVDVIAKDILQKSEFSGVDFFCVKNKNGSSVLPDVEQLIISTQIQPSLIKDQPSIQKADVCPICGRVKYQPSGIGMYTFLKEAFTNMPDICKTSEYFGWGKNAHHLILVSQCVYRSIIENHLDRGLYFSPIDLV